MIMVTVAVASYSGRQVLIQRQRVKYVRGQGLRTHGGLVWGIRTAGGLSTDDERKRNDLYGKSSRESDISNAEEEDSVNQASIKSDISKLPDDTHMAQIMKIQ